MTVRELMDLLNLINDKSSEVRINNRLTGDDVPIIEVDDSSEIVYLDVMM